MRYVAVFLQQTGVVLYGVAQPVCSDLLMYRLNA